jgi:glucuronoarabinoxylan endo-1,4-beta-xylanase
MKKPTLLTLLKRAALSPLHLINTRLKKYAGKSVLLVMSSAGFTLGQAQTCTVDWNSRYQRIDGFGASSAFSGFTWTTAMADMFFSTNNGTGRSAGGTNYPFTGIGLSLLRSQIQPGGFANGNEITLMQYAQARGVKIWSAPWSPQASFKSNGNTVGGTILASAYQAYANQLAGYVAKLKSNSGISNLYALSIQNEPDATVGYVSCYWNAQQFHDFIPFLYNALVASNVSSTRIMFPESENWQDYSNLVVTTMNDTTTSNMVGIIADHNYDGATGPADLTKNNYGKPLWETEVSTFDANDGSIDNGVYWAQRIYLFLTQAQVNAYHFWWLINLNADNEGLTDINYIPNKRMYTMGQYSRFIRPGFYRIDAASTSDASISAFNDTNSGNFVIVAVNPDVTPISQTFNLGNFPGTVSAVTPWITSASLSLSNQAPVIVANDSFMYSLPATSVVTFVGRVSVIPTNILISSVSFDPVAQHAVLTWNSIVGATYSVIKTNVLDSSATNWPSLVTGYPVGGAVSGSLSYTDTTANASSAFYRVKSP